MVVEIIDLSDSPPSSPRSSNNATTRLINFNSVSVEKEQFEKFPIPLMGCTNPNLYHTDQPQTSLWPIAKYTCEPSEVATFQPNMPRAATILEPTPTSNTYLSPGGAGLKEPWTHKEHELFMRGLIKYGKGSWSQIAEHFVQNKTPQEVESYAAWFFKHQPSTASLMSLNNNLMAASASVSDSMSMVVNEPQHTHMFFPENASFLLAPSYGEASSNTNTNTVMHGFPMQTSGANTSMNASDNGEVDLELRLGLCQPDSDMFNACMDDKYI
ncbi:uncharacterized protein LOC109788720 [Cajanus cajan]|uniref:uncharacterized protein LOC109788720 n=1 Tax=Cajanus cajan TaxID=3821 RepID=UPI00098DA23D|nr:uncharacterized protein LOC109788720 [Cajanus cajan]